MRGKMTLRMEALQETELKLTMRQAGRVRWLLVDLSSDRKSAEHDSNKKKNCLENYHQRFGYVWKVTRQGVLIIPQFLVEKNIAIIKE